MDRIIRASFLTDPFRVHNNSVKGVEDCLHFTMKELEEAFLSKKYAKTPALDCALTKVNKLLFHRHLDSDHSASLIPE